MRLMRLYLAGFKSFAAPTEILLPDARVAIVGPNGCGKSNLIDAIRWVLGESSARQLRGQALDDVIFAGSGQRPPASLAVVELTFDNSERRLSGAFAAFDHIMIRRSLGRDGQSRYEINQIRVRRRDVVELFLGTGVGARSYSVIEQGQINRIVDARPEELRGYLEETAGISLYRERRRETETRIAQTQDNLSRLADLAEELGRQQSQLERQAKAAERYRVLQQQRRRLLAEQAAVQHVLAERARAVIFDAWQAADTHAQTLATQLATLEQTLAAAEQTRQTAQQHLQHVQAQQYPIAAERAQCEGHLGALAARLDSVVQQRQDDLVQRERLATAITQQQREHTQWEAARSALEQQRQALQEARADAQSELRAADVRLSEIRDAWRQAHEQLAQPQQHWAAARAEHAALDRQRQRLEASPPTVAASAHEIAALQQHALALESQLTQVNSDQAAVEAALHTQQADLAEQEVQGAATQAQAQVAQKTWDTLQAELKGLEQLLTHQPAHKSGTKTPAAESPFEPLIERLASARADAWWGHALGARIEAQCVDDLDVLGAEWARAGSLPPSGFWVSPLTLPEEGPEAPHQSHELPAAVLSDAALTPWLTDWQHSRHPATSITEALAARHRLPLGHCFVLADGWQVGRHWLGRVAHDQAAIRLAQHARLNALHTECAAAEHRAHAEQAVLAQQQAELNAARQRLAELNRSLRDHEQHALRLQSQRADARRKYQHLVQIQAEQHASAAQRRDELARLAAECAELGRTTQVFAQAVDAATHTRDQLNTQQQVAEAAVQTLRRLAGEAAQHTQAAERAGDLNRHQIAQTQQFLARDQAQLAQIDARMTQFGDKIDALVAQKTERQAEHARILLKQEAIAIQEASALSEVAQHTEYLQKKQAERQTAQFAYSQAQLTAQTAAMQHAQAEVRSEHTEQALTEALMPLQDDRVTLDSATIERLADQPDTPAQQAAMRESLVQQIDRLGAVNLTAIAAFAETHTRKTELEAQMADVQTALSQLTEAIRTLDRQTRAQFRRVFDEVNTRLGPLFVQLFGGGEARLGLSGDDELNAGVELFARPPGKKVTHLSLLSGGERALTAVALIFALFELNPAPFCILDEVDAPLDEANVGRFCAMVSALSDRVQFLFVTHNKTTMASAQALIGVTMREAGVSRIVSVDVDRAVQLLES